jgi:hypothetical protein
MTYPYEFDSVFKHIAFIEKCLNNYECTLYKLNKDKIHFDLQRRYQSLKDKLYHFKNINIINQSEYNGYLYSLEYCKSAIDSLKDRLDNKEYTIGYVTPDKDLFKENFVQIEYKDDKVSEVTDGNITYHNPEFINGDIVLLSGLKFSIGNLNADSATSPEERNYLVISFYDNGTKQERKIRLPFETTVS